MSDCVRFTGEKKRRAGCYCSTLWIVSLCWEKKRESRSSWIRPQLAKSRQSFSADDWSAPFSTMESALTFGWVRNIQLPQEADNRERFLCRWYQPLFFFVLDGCYFWKRNHTKNITKVTPKLYNHLHSGQFTVSVWQLEMSGEVVTLYFTLERIGIMIKCVHLRYQ